MALDRKEIKLCGTWLRGEMVDCVQLESTYISAENIVVKQGRTVLSHIIVALVQFSFGFSLFLTVAVGIQTYRSTKIFLDIRQKDVT